MLNTLQPQRGSGCSAEHAELGDAEMELSTLEPGRSGGQSWAPEAKTGDTGVCSCLQSSSAACKVSPPSRYSHMEILLLSICGPATLSLSPQKHKNKEMGENLHSWPHVFPPLLQEAEQPPAPCSGAQLLQRNVHRQEKYISHGVISRRQDALEVIKPLAVELRGTQHAFGINETWGGMGWESPNTA